MTITKEERTRLREECKRFSNIPSSTDFKITRLLDALEAAEARAEAAERERDFLAKNSGCPSPHDEFKGFCLRTSEDRGCAECRLEWARQQARGGENE